MRFDPLTGELILGSNSSFSYKKIVDVVEIEVNQQMIVDGMLDIEGILLIDGELSILG